MLTNLCAPFLERIPITGAAISVGSVDTVPSLLVAASDATAAQLAELQFDLGEGPQVQAWRSGRSVLASSIGPDGVQSWPILGPAAFERGIRALFAFPILAGRSAVGVVDLYRDTEGPLGDRAVATAMELVADVAEPALRRAAEASSADEIGSVAAGMAERREVHQATGMILAQLDVTAAEALLRLRAYAFATGRSSTDVARDVVARTLDFRELP
ncbi:GAF and ANTAR domain-containing protein [Microbacteriaceae bacterium VKM Ac-2854]|nr:GAF and ANTAR domain-containing protein [Microbacteriaceae bacterium VKM Ac-2854]